MLEYLREPHNKKADRAQCESLHVIMSGANLVAEVGTKRKYQPMVAIETLLMRERSSVFNMVA